MFFPKHRSSGLKRTAVFCAAVVAMFVSVTRGIEMCFCDEGIEACGEVCHECHEETDPCTHENDCEHFRFDAFDFVGVQSTVDIPFVTIAGFDFVPAGLPLAEKAVLRVVSTAPPDFSFQQYRFYSPRLLQRS